ncbi:UNVERIFIED_CONTAM: hypothetical protein RMT77_011160 [Armadillidium vulgare]
MSGHLSLKWNNHSSSLLRSLTKVQSKEQYCDATIACQGKYFPVHRIVLSTCSEYFEEIFERIQNQHPYIIFKDIEPREMELLLNYMYQGEVNVLQENLPMLIKAAEALKIKGLAVPDDIPVKEPPPTKKRSNNSNDYPQAKRRTEEKRKRRESNEGHSSNDNEESYSSESYAKNLPKTDHSEELKVIKDEPIDTGYEDNDISKSFEIPNPITEGKITDSETKIQDFSSLENVTYTKDGNIVQNEPFENQSSSWSTYSEGEQIGNLSVQDDICESLQEHSNWNIDRSLDAREEQIGNSFSINSASQSLNTNFPVRCRHCSFRSPNWKELHFHWLSKHSKDKPYSCSLCQFSCKFKQNLVIHMRIHSGEKPFKCTHCGTVFRHSNSLRRHLKNKIQCNKEILKQNVNHHM